MTSLLNQQVFQRDLMLQEVRERLAENEKRIEIKEKFPDASEGLAEIEKQEKNFHYNN